MTLVEYDGDSGGGLEMTDAEGVRLRFEAPLLRRNLFLPWASVTMHPVFGSDLRYVRRCWYSERGPEWSGLSIVAIGFRFRASESGFNETDKSGWRCRVPGGEQSRLTLSQRRTGR